MARVERKRCGTCGMVKPLTAFFRRRRGCEQRHSWCKQCQYAYLHDYWRRNATAMRARANRNYRKHRAHYKAYQMRPEVCFKRAAREAAAWAVKLGLIPRKTACELCGIDDQHAKLHRHHPNYIEPLNVIWLCTRCHGEVHRKRA